MSQPTGIESARKLIDSFKNGDVNSAAGAFHPDCVVREPASLPYGGDWRGKDGFLELIGKMTEHYEVAINGYDVWDAGGDIVVMRASTTFRARSGGPSLDTAITEIYTIKDGLILDADIYPKDVAAMRDLVRPG